MSHYILMNQRSGLETNYLDTGVSIEFGSLRKI